VPPRVGADRRRQVRAAPAEAERRARYGVRAEVAGGEARGEVLVVVGGLPSVGLDAQAGVEVLGDGAGVEPADLLQARRGGRIEVS
jgi:hypothetical protein